jgi:hypothetical protein
MSRRPSSVALRRSVALVAAGCLALAACGGSDGDGADSDPDDSSQLCVDALARDLRTLILPLDLDGSFRISCDK